MLSLKNIVILFTVFLLSTFTNAFPIFDKRQIVTRMHTASTTNTVTDVYSTTTKIIVAPTVYFIIDGDATSTSTAIPANVDPTALPTTTIVLNRKDLANVPGLDTTANQNSAPVTTPAAASTPAAVSTPTAASNTPTQGKDEVTKTTSTLRPTSEAGKEVVTALDSNVFEPSEANGHNHENAVTTNVPVIISTTTAEAAAPISSTQIAQQSTPAAENNNDNNNDNSNNNDNNNNNNSNNNNDNNNNDNNSNGNSNSGSSSSNGGSQLSSVPYSLAYSPYNADGSCKNGGDVFNDLQNIKNKGISRIRVYGTDCNSLETIQPACQQLGIKINQGLWISDAGVDSLDASLGLLIQYGQSKGWDVFEYITVGNEAINSGYCSVDDLIAKINSVKGQLQSAGYSGQITTSEPPVTFENHPELCKQAQIDFVGINPHSYFDSNCDAAGSGEFVKGQLELVQQSCGTSNVIITETGYPSQGAANGGNMPTKANQLLAVQSILDHNDQVTILTWTDDFWKNPGPYGIEQYFGIGDLLP